MRNIRSRWMINGIALIVAGVMLGRLNAERRVILTPDEYGLWEGRWRADVVTHLIITDVDANGFEYSIEEQVRPDSPNLTIEEQGKTSFLGSLAAKSQESNDTLSLAIATDDRHDRTIAYQGTIYQYERRAFRAGFDCDKATTPVEITICQDERIAAGDREMNRLYRDLLKTLPAEQTRTLRSTQRAWLTKRNRNCLRNDAVSRICLARLYSDRLVTLARLKHPSLGAGLLFDAAYVSAMLSSGANPSEDIATRLAIYPLDAFGAEPDITWQADTNGVLIEQDYKGAGISIWPPIDIDFPIVGYAYSHMLFVDWNGTVWTAAYADPIPSQETQELVKLSERHATWRIWADAGRSHFSIQSETGFEFKLEPRCFDSREHPLATLSAPPRIPDLVKSWVDRHLVFSDPCCCG